MQRAHLAGCYKLVTQAIYKHAVCYIRILLLCRAHAANSSALSLKTTAQQGRLNFDTNCNKTSERFHVPSLIVVSKAIPYQLTEPFSQNKAHKHRIQHAGVVDFNFSRLLLESSEISLCYGTSRSIPKSISKIAAHWLVN